MAEYTPPDRLHREPMTAEQKRRRGLAQVKYLPQGIEWSLHFKKDCNRPCPIHAPSKHHMVTWPINIRETLLTERLCAHGVGHPDPDSIVWMDDHSYPGAKGSWGVHGCDGCCGDWTE
jgi:hypothetical protein